MANKKPEGTVKVRRPRAEQSFVCLMYGGDLIGPLDKASVVAEFETQGEKLLKVYSIKPVFVRKVEVIKFGKERKTRSDAGTAKADV